MSSSTKVFQPPYGGMLADYSITAHVVDSASHLDHHDYGAEGFPGVTLTMQQVYQREQFGPKELVDISKRLQLDQAKLLVARLTEAIEEVEAGWTQDRVDALAIEMVAEGELVYVEETDTYHLPDGSGGYGGSGGWPGREKKHAVARIMLDRARKQKEEDDAAHAES